MSAYHSRRALWTFEKVFATERCENRYRIRADRATNSAAVLLVADGARLANGGGRICEKFVLLGVLLKWRT